VGILDSEGVLNLPLYAAPSSRRIAEIVAGHMSSAAIVINLALYLIKRSGYWIGGGGSSYGYWSC